MPPEACLGHSEQKVDGMDGWLPYANGLLRALSVPITMKSKKRHEKETACQYHAWGPSCHLQVVCGLVWLERGVNILRSCNEDFVKVCEVKFVETSVYT